MHERREEISAGGGGGGKDEGVQGEKFNIRDIMHRRFWLAGSLAGDSRNVYRSAYSFLRLPEHSAEQPSFCGKFESSDGCTDWLLKAKDDAPAAAARSFHNLSCPLQLRNSCSRWNKATVETHVRHVKHVELYRK